MKTILTKSSFLYLIFFQVFFSPFLAAKKETEKPKKTRHLVYSTPLLTQDNIQNLKQTGFWDPRLEIDNSKVARQTPFGQLNLEDVLSHTFTENGKIYVFYKGYKLELTIRPDVQKEVTRELQNAHSSQGATVIIEPHTGRILALMEKNESKYLASDHILTRARAPAASLTKIITATSAIEKKNLDPDYLIHFNGGCGKLKNKNWMRNPTKDKQTISLAKAFGLSCNTAFARLILYDSGLKHFSTYVDKFMFNKPIPSDVRFETSLFLMPDASSASFQDVAEVGAGFGPTRLTPLHAALLSATVLNEGIMMEPYLVEAAYDARGKEVYRAKVKEIGQVFSSLTAEKLEILMRHTVLFGSRLSIPRRQIALYRQHHIVGKTGTLCDPEDRNRLYTWFSGAAMTSDRLEKVAIGTLIISPNQYIIRAASIAQKTLFEILKLHKQSKDAVFLK
jgi:peptidoglycan glycosyltransferase